MSVSSFESPTIEDWWRIYKSSPLDKVFNELDNFQAQRRVDNGINGFIKGIELSGLIYEVQQRLGDTGRSYILMMFYYEKGIPDKRWYISPGRKGESFEYFPDFEQAHFHIKEWFDFYSDTFYYKLFSAWNLIGHILNVEYRMEVKKVYFDKAVDALKNKDPALYANLNGIRNLPAFQKANKIRNDITHNYLPNTTGIALHKKSQYTTTIAMKEYITSEEIVANTNENLDLFASTLKYISA